MKFHEPKANQSKFHASKAGGSLLILLSLVIYTFVLGGSALFAENAVYLHESSIDLRESSISRKSSDRVPVAGFASDRMERGAPAGWELEKYKGTPVMKLEKEGGKFCLHMISDGKSSFGVRKELKLNVEEYPFLNWRWKALKLPEGGDVRKPDADDQAIQIYVAFTAMGWPKKLNTPVVGYIWDNEAPKELMVASSQLLCGKIRYVVVRNKDDKLGEWYTEKRNIYEDYKRLFKDIDEDKLPLTTAGIQFSINSQHTGSEGRSYICDVYFSKN